MTKYFSYLDTALQIIHINIESMLDDEQKIAFAEMLISSETSRHARTEILSKHLEIHLQSDPELKRKIIHETIHYLQGVYYPFLYYLNWLEYHNLMQLRESLKESELESIVINEIGMTQELFNNYKLSSVKYRFVWQGDQLKVGERATDHELGAFCMQDLLESVTTIFDYKMAASSATSDGYYTWIQDPANKGYKNLYKFISEKLGRDFAYDLLPLLVQAAFNTTEPISCFCHAVTYISVLIGDYKLVPIMEYPKLILDWLESKLGVVELDPEQDVIIDYLKVGVLRHAQLLKIVDYTNYNDVSLHYPQAVHLMKFAAQMGTVDQIDNFLASADASSFEMVISQFFPYAIHYYFLDIGGRNSLLIISPEFLDAKAPNQMEYPTYVKEMMKFKESTTALFTKIPPEAPHNCHHISCEYYATELCRKWNAIPKDHQSCGFPAWFAYFYYRKIDMENKTLQKIGKKKADENWDLYWDNSYKKRAFEYIKKSGVYILTISKTDIKNKDQKLAFQNLLTHLRQKEQLKGSHLIGTLSFDFFEYNKDKRELFEIPEVIAWFRKLKADCEEIFCLLDMEVNADLRTVLVPMLVKHEKVGSNEHGFLVKFDEKELQKFLFNESVIFMNFMLKHQITDLNKSIKQFKILSNAI